MDATFAFVHEYARVKYEDIPSLAVEAEKKQLLDTLGVALAGVSQPGVKELLEVVKKWGGRRQSTIIGYGLRVPAPNAAQVNATMAHALDYDDGHPEALVHTGAVVVPTALAVAERKGKVTGKEFITATALGTDLMCRLGLSTRPTGNVAGTGWHFTSLYGFLGAAVVAGKILGLNEGKMVNALGVAYHQCSGNMQCVTDGALTKRMGPGFAARGGITAALMAEKGISGATNCLEGEFGLYNLYHQGDYDAKTLIRDLGKKFEGIDVGFKPYPCCGITHVFIDAALALVNEHTIRPDDIQEITVFGGEAARILCSPLEVKRNPRNYVDSQFSIPWAVAVAFSQGRPSIDHFTETAINSKDILRVAQKVNFEFNPGLTRHGAFGTGIVKVVTKRGEAYSKQIDYPLGSRERPLSFSDCVVKFFSCASYSTKPIAKSNMKRVVELIGRLEKLDDMTEVIQLVC